jgi:energy-coupling factor transporter ATP-binding protein EcfA2
MAALDMSAILKSIGETSWMPRAPRRPEDTGLPFLYLAELASKIFFSNGPQRLVDLAARIKLPAGTVEPLVDFLRRERLCEVASGSTGATPLFTLTQLGRARTEEALRLSQYAGAAPVPLEAYVEQVRKQAVLDLRVTREDMHRAFQGVLVRDAILDQFGAAMNSGRGIFIYGPAGSGKTFIAEHLTGLMSGDVYVPYALLVGNQVIQMYDPHWHRPVQREAEGPADFLHNAADPRWVRCRRPVVVTGGELTLGMLDLQFDHGSRFYVAPPQLKANNGLLIIDDLGRQLVRPKDLMNRWIVPLDRRVDHLALHTGENFMVPFDVTVVFSSNLAPAELADEAFLRRLGYKIHLGPIDEELFRQLCRQVARQLGMPCSEAMIDYIVARFRRENRPMVACTPRDLLCQVRDRARYRGQPPEPTEELLSWAWQNYFAHESLQPFTTEVKQ